MSRLISSIPSSELGNLNFVDLDEQEMITLAGGEALVQTGDVNVNAPNAAQYAAYQAGYEGIVKDVTVGPVKVAS